jgi:hypothetical protein
MGHTRNAYKIMKENSSVKQRLAAGRKSVERFVLWKSVLTMWDEWKWLMV